jgi:AraC family transcriptional regulator of adaptative response/methylated-DNA-[protein]-cysteine methyltransferase
MTDPTGDYARIARAIDYIAAHVQGQPTLNDVAQVLQLSPFHTQKLFRRWAGISPKQYLQVLTVARAKQLLRESHSLLDTSLASGLSGSSRLHDHFVTLEAVTPGEFRRQGDGIDIRYGSHPSPFGTVVLGVTARGICYLSFCDSSADATAALADLQRQWAGAQLIPDQAGTANLAQQCFRREHTRPLPLYVSGTNFQISVWKALLQIPPGRVVSYGDIATAIGKSGANRAVGTAVGANPVSVLIPCHRVIRQSGGLGGYRWGLPRKQALWLWENMEDTEETTDR